MVCQCLCKLRLSPCALLTCVVACVLFLGLAVVLILKSPGIDEYIMHSSLIVEPGTAMFPNWVDLPVPLVTSIYLFNVTNAKDFATKGAKPRLEQVGPYVYYEYHHKTKVQFTESNGTVTYQQIRTYVFQPHLSSGTPDDKIVTLNAVAATVNAIALKWNQLEEAVLGPLLSGALAGFHEELLTETTVHKLLFDGYDDPVLEKLSHDPVLKQLKKWFSPDTPDRFAYYYQRNGSDWYDGVFNIFTGQTDLHKLCQMHAWNYSTHLPFYKGHCGDVKGEADFFSPGQTKTHLDYFLNDLCRPIKIAFDTTGVKHSIDVYTYKVDRNLFANATEVPDNWCFDPYEREFPSGVYGVGPCHFNAPIFMSQPHFYQADPSYVQGLAPGSVYPNEKEHGTVFNVEPRSGLPVDIVARFQVSFYLRRISNIKLFEGIPEQIMFPTVWFETRMDLPSGILVEIWLLSNLLVILTVSGCTLLLLSLLLGSCVGIHCCNQRAGANIGSSEEDDAARERLVPEEENEDATTYGTSDATSSQGR